MNKLIAAVVLTLGVSAFAMASVDRVPEIDPGSATAAMSLLTAAIVAVRGRRRR